MKVWVLERKLNTSYDEEWEVVGVYSEKPEQYCSDKDYNYYFEEYTVMSDGPGVSHETPN